MREKKYVDVDERHIVNQIGEDVNDIEVTIEPIMMTWVDDNGAVTRYEIERILDIRRIASMTGGIGDRYTVRIEGRQRYIWRERDTEAWFVEKKV